MQEETEDRKRPGLRIAAIAVLLLVLFVIAFLLFVKTHSPFGFISEFDGHLIPSPIPMPPGSDFHDKMIRWETDDLYRYYAFHADFAKVRKAMETELKADEWDKKDKSEPDTVYFLRRRDNAVIGLTNVRPNWNVPPGTICVAVIYAKPGWFEQKIEALRKSLGW